MLVYSYFERIKVEFGDLICRFLWWIYEEGMFILMFLFIDLYEYKEDRVILKFFYFYIEYY